MKQSPAKQNVLDAASFLFYQKGFYGTSVRDIADKADVNVSLISYYFKSKQGLLEYGVIQYYEQYLKAIEDSIESTKDDTALGQLKNLIKTIIQYRHEHQQFSSFILRELSLDSVFVREMAVTYIAKENYYISHIFSAVLTTKKRREQAIWLMQLKGMLVTPYILQNEWKNQVVTPQKKDVFVESYVMVINEWIDYIFTTESIS